MSYLRRLLTSSHQGATDVNAAPPSVALNLFVPSTPAKKFTRPLPDSGVNSESEMPIFRSRHSSASAPPGRQRDPRQVPLALVARQARRVRDDRRISARRDVDRHLAPPAADLDHQRDAAADGDVGGAVAEREVAHRVGLRAHHRRARQRHRAGVAGRAIRVIRERRVRDEHVDVGQRNLARRIVHLARQPRDDAAAADRLDAASFLARRLLTLQALARPLPRAGVTAEANQARAAASARRRRAR